MRCFEFIQLGLVEENAETLVRAGFSAEGISAPFQAVARRPEFYQDQVCPVYSGVPLLLARSGEEPLSLLGGKCLEVIVAMRRIILFTVLILTVSAASAQDKPAPKKVPARRAVAAPGKQTYIHYCASCHGVNARGDGPAAFVLKTTPPDLTTLATRHGGKFPYKYVSEVLRFGTRILSHGSSDMPIWGPVFGSLDNYDEVAARKRIKDLSDYLASLQQKES